MPPSLLTTLTAIAALAAVLGLILLASRVARLGGWAPRGPAPGAGVLEVRQILPLDASRRLHLVRCGERSVLLLTGGPADLVIGWLPEREDPS